MRVIFTSWAWPSHLYALVPLAWACRAAGHEVLVASQPGLLDDIRHTGLCGVPVGKDVDAVGMVRGYLLPAGENGAAGGAPRVGNGPRALQMFLAHADSMVDDLAEVATAWSADLVVFEPTALAGPVAASAAGIPAVRLLYGTDLMVRARGMLPDLLAPLAQRHGTDGVDPFGVATVDPTPASLQVPVDYRRIPMRYVPYNGPGTVRPVPRLQRTRPRVCVTWGHTLSKVDTSRFLAGDLTRAISELDIEVVVAVAADQVPLLGPLPDSVHVVVDTPLHHLLPDCDLVLGHGGAGTILTALAHGLPLLLVPQLPDHAGHASRVLSVGAGEVLVRDEATPSAVRTHLSRLIDDNAPERAAARAVQAEIGLQPSPAAVVAVLETLALDAVVTS